MAIIYPTTKGGCIKALKAVGIRKHPRDLRKLEHMKHEEVLKLYEKYVGSKQQA